MVIIREYGNGIRECYPKTKQYLFLFHHFQGRLAEHSLSQMELHHRSSNPSAQQPIQPLRASSRSNNMNWRQTGSIQPFDSAKQA